MASQFSQYLKDRRGPRSCEQIALDAGLSRATWSRLERGYPPDLQTLIRIHLAFGTGYDLLIALYIQDFLSQPELEDAYTQAE